MNSPADLLQRTRLLLERGQYSDAPREFRRLAEPARDNAFETLEKELDATLPAPLKEIYTSLSNGGVGPGYGLLGIGDGVLDDQGRDLVATRNWFLSWSEEDEICPWPAFLLPILHWGCGIYACIDVTTLQGRIVDFDHHEWDETPETWNDCFQEVSPSFTKWWEDWVTEKEQELQQVIEDKIDYRSG